jgi:hypothetical protein
MHIIDRRLNPRGKSLANRQRFIRRARALIRRAVRDAAAGRGVREVDGAGEVVIDAGGVGEPQFRRDADIGRRRHVLPGNRRFVPGDTIPKERAGRGSGGEAGDDGDGEDAFRFALTREEFLELFLEDLELPDLAKQKLKELERPAWRRAGHMSAGAPANLLLARTLRNSLSRRLALGRPKREEIERLRGAIETAENAGDAETAARLTAELEPLLRRAAAVPWIDPIDLRYRRLEPQPRPTAQAVMFCLMDVSGSMTEHMKDLAKRFYMLLHLFLSRRYRHVEVVFIRHTHRAEEVDEDTFFHSPETGGTVVSTALEEMLRVVRKRYPPHEWNIYAAQASDGDNLGGDNAKTEALLTGQVLPICQYYAYLEVGEDDGADDPEGFSQRLSTLWRVYAQMRTRGVPLEMRKVTGRTEIYPVFRQLFERRPAASA